MSKAFQSILSQLTEQERKEIVVKNIHCFDKLIPLLLKRVSSKNVQDLSNLMKKSLLPSICPTIDEEIEKLFSKIDENNNLLFDDNIQNKIKYFVNKRFERDKQVVFEKTSDISKLVILMQEYLNEAILSNGTGSKNIFNIKEKIVAINVNENGLETLIKLRNELLNAVSSIEKEMNNVTNKLQNGKTKVQELEEKVKTLEDELIRTKSENRQDHLTGLLTRKAFSEEVIKIEKAYTRVKSQYAVVFFDLDYFKKLNDTYGHECGDVVLSTFGKILNKSVRKYDIVGRYGGEEFVAIIHFNFNKELLEFLKRIKTIVTENRFKYQDKRIKVTFSAGVAIRSNYETYENTLQKADKLLYQAKEKGRNKIILEKGMEI